MSRPKKQSPQPIYKACYAVDYRGDNDDQLALLFRGLPDNILIQVFDHLSRGGYLFSHTVIFREFEIISHNGQGTYHTVVAIYDHNTQLCSLPNLLTLIESRLQAECKCKITKLAINKFLNV